LKRSGERKQQGKEGEEKDGRGEREGRGGRGYIILLERGRNLGTLVQRKAPRAVKRGKEGCRKEGRMRTER
jgi:hypothetical protein